MEPQHRSFPDLGVPCVGVAIIRIVVYWDLYRGALASKRRILEYLGVTGLPIPPQDLVTRRPGDLLGFGFKPFDL